MTIYKLKTPIAEEEIRKLRANDVLYVSGTVVTARDQAHRRALEYFKKRKPMPLSLEGLAVFHSGLLMRRQGVDHFFESFSGWSGSSLDRKVAAAPFFLAVCTARVRVC